MDNGREKHGLLPQTPFGRPRDDLIYFFFCLPSGCAGWQICRAILSIHHNGLEVNAGVQSEPEVVNGVIFVMDELAFSDGVVQ